MIRFFPLLLFFLSACTISPPLVTDTMPPSTSTGITGNVHDSAGAPSHGAMVYAYRSARGGLRGPADFAAKVDSNGAYLLDLVDGSYYLVARQRSGGADLGPPRIGDAWALFPQNPVTVQRNQLSHADFRLAPVSHPRLHQGEGLTTSSTFITGTLLDADAHPLSGAVVLGYPTPSHQGKPAAISAPSDDQGHFTLYLPQGGSWCLLARSRTRGQPTASEPVGTLGAGESGCRELANDSQLAIGAIHLTPFGASRQSP